MKRIRLSTAIVAFIPTLVGFVWPGTVEWLCTRGIKQYEAGKFEEAEESFSRALEADAGNAALQFNRGTALYHQRKLEEAGEAFESEMKHDDQELARDAAYNAANARFSAGDYQGAIESYKQTLRLDPADADAKYNLELALRKQQDEQKEEDEQQNDEQQEDEKDEQQQQNQQQEDQEQRDEQQQEDQEQRQERDSPPAEQPEEGELTEAQAQRLLHALTSQDAEMQKLIRRSPQQRQPGQGEKDW